MRESYQHPSSSRLGGLKNNNAVIGEVVEVQGGHIVKSTGTKDRHSKVCTAKGPRDRRVRLAAPTAIQFYDVQDRLGYDRPSKAVDWLIKKAKAAIDELAELPAWHPTATSSSGPNVTFEPENARTKLQEESQQHNIYRHADLMISNVSGSSSKRAMTIFGGENEQILSFLPPSLDTDTIKSFFPMGVAAGEATSSAVQFQNFPTHHLLSRNINNNKSSQDLKLSLQSFQDPSFLHHNPTLPHTNPSHHSEQQEQHVLLSGGTPLGFDGWPVEQHQPASELSRLQRLASWNSGGDSATTAGFLQFSSPQHLLDGQHNQMFITTSQRGPLQSSNTPSFRAWMDHHPIAISMADDHQDHHAGAGAEALPVYPSSSLFSGGIGFASSGYDHIPARIQGDEEEQDGYSDKPSSASSEYSRH